MHWRGRSISIRWSLFKNLLLLVILISGSLLVYSLIGANRAIRHLSTSLIEEASATAEDKLERFFAPIAKTVEIVHDLADRGVFTPDNPGAATRVLLPVLSAIPQMSSINTGNEAGDAFLLVKRKNEWLSISKRGGATMATWRQIDESGNVLKTWMQQLDFDPRTRPWYKAAQEEFDSEVRWTEPYGFVPTGDPGITATVRVRGPNGSYVMAFDILLEDLSEVGQTIHASLRGTAFVLTEDDRLLVPPSTASEGERRNLLLKRPEDLPALSLLAQSIRLSHGRRNEGPFQIRHNGEKWWCGFEPYTIGSRERAWIGVLIPESDLLGDMQIERIALLSLTLLTLGAATLMSLALSRAYSEPLRKLVQHSSRLQALETGVPVDVDSNLKEVQALADAQENMRRALDSFARYVPVSVVRELLERGEAAAIGGRDVEVTVLFSDIAGFTTIAESMSASELTGHMSDYFEEIVEILEHHGATVDKLIGDAVMAFWGAPKAVDNHARPAVKAVLEIREWLERANRRWKANGLPPLPTRFGLASGEVTVGNIGAHSRLSYTVLGDAVNLAHRLEGLNSQLGTWVLADVNVRRAAGSDFEWRELEAVEVKGRTTAVRVFELLGRRRSRPKSGARLE